MGSLSYVKASEVKTPWRKDEAWHHMVVLESPKRGCTNRWMCFPVAVETPAYWRCQGCGTAVKDSVGIKWSLPELVTL